MEKYVKIYQETNYCGNAVAINEMMAELAPLFSLISDRGRCFHYLTQQLFTNQEKQVKNRNNDCISMLTANNEGGGIE